MATQLHFPGSSCTQERIDAATAEYGQAMAFRCDPTISECEITGTGEGTYPGTLDGCRDCTASCGDDTPVHPTDDHGNGNGNGNGNGPSPTPVDPVIPPKSDHTWFIIGGAVLFLLILVFLMSLHK